MSSYTYLKYASSVERVANAVVAFIALFINCFLKSNPRDLPHAAPMVALRISVGMTCEF